MKLARLIPPLSLALLATAIGYALSGGRPGHADPVTYGRPAIDTVLDEGTALPRQQAINFTGAGVTCANNGAGRRLDCTIPGGAGVTSVSATAPLTSSGGSTPTISIGSAVTAALGGTGQSSYTAGDLLYASGATALSKLGIGASNRVLTSSGSAPQWTALGGDVSGSIGAVSVDKLKGSTVSFAGVAAGDVLIWSGTAWANYPFTSFGGSSIQSIGTSNSAGSSGDFALSNHVHKIGTGAINDRAMIASGTITASEIATSGLFGWSGAHSFTAAGDAVTVDNNILIGGTVKSKANTTMLLKSQQADGTSAQFVMDTANSVTAAHPYLYLKNAGTLMLDYLVSGSTHYIDWYNTSGGAEGGFIISSTPAFAFYGFSGGVYPYTDAGIDLGIAGHSWASVKSKAYYGVQQNNTASGTVTIAPASGEVYRLVASGNINAVNVSNGSPGQKLRLILIQDAGGTSTWVTTFSNVRLAGGSFTKTTTANAVDVVSLVWDDTFADWLETGRALGVQ